jgi:hypothetical protein
VRFKIQPFLGDGEKFKREESYLNPYTASANSEIERLKFNGRKFTSEIAILKSGSLNRKS